MLRHKFRLQAVCLRDYLNGFPSHCPVALIISILTSNITWRMRNAVRSSNGDCGIITQHFYLMSMSVFYLVYAVTHGYLVFPIYVAFSRKTSEKASHCCPLFRLPVMPRNTLKDSWFSEVLYLPYFRIGEYIFFMIIVCKQPRMANLLCRQQTGVTYHFEINLLSLKSSGYNIVYRNPWY